MKRFFLLAVLISLAACKTEEERQQSIAAHLEQHRRDLDASTISIYGHLPHPQEDSILSRTEIACHQTYDLEREWLYSLTQLKDSQHDTAAYNELKRSLIAQHRCRMFKKGTKVFVTGENLIAGYIYFRERGSAYYYATYNDAIK